MCAIGGICLTGARSRLTKLRKQLLLLYTRERSIQCTHGFGGCGQLLRKHHLAQTLRQRLWHNALHRH